MKCIKKLLYLFVLIMLLGSYKSQTHAQNINSVTYINPLYEGLISEEDLITSEDLRNTDQFVTDLPTYSSNSDTYVSDADFISSEIIKPGMKNRNNIIHVKFSSDNSEEYYSSNYTSGIEGYLFNSTIFNHTGIATEGDYLRWQYAGWTAGGSCNYDNESGLYLYDITYIMTYYTDSNQEAMVDDAVASFISNNISDSDLTDLEKVQIIYDYICSNVTCDSVDTSLKYTCYGALIDHKAVCQGFSLLFYRLALESGLDARFIASQTHGWNIVKIGDFFYNIDATWDSGKTADKYDWFLKSNTSFENNTGSGSLEHIRLTEFNNKSFNSLYPMSETDFGTPNPDKPQGPGINNIPDTDAQVVSFDMAQILRLSYLTRPDYTQIISDLPEETNITLSDGSIVSIPLEWECLGEYDGIIQYYYYEFDIITDNLPYKLSDEAIIPYAGIFIGSGNITVDSVTGRTNETIIANFLFSQLDCNNATVAGILANIYSESGFNPVASVVDTNGKISYGICQWNGSRFDSLRNYCENHGLNYSTLQGQLIYLKHELINVSPYKSRWTNEIKSYENSADAAYNVGYQWAARFEVCATAYRAGRGRLARDTYWPEYASYTLNGLIPMIDGTTVLYQNGSPCYWFTGLYYDSSSGYKFIQGGYYNTYYNDLFYDEHVGWVKIMNGTVDYAYNDMFYSPQYGWWKVKNGTIDAGYSDLFCSPTIGWWKVINGTLDVGYSDLYWSPTMGWWKINGGSVDFGYSDMYYSPQYGWWKIIGGTMDTGYTDLYCSPTIGWWKITNGTLDVGYNDLYWSPTMGWWKVSGGSVDFGYSDMFLSPQFGWWKVLNGAMDVYYSDIYFSPTIGWWKIKDGTIDFTYTDLYWSPTMGWWKINGGSVDFGYSDMYYSPQYGWWKIICGTMDVNYSDLYYSPTIGWWKVKGGTLDVGYNDLYWSPTMGWYKITNGSVDFGYNDMFYSPQYGWWKITNGAMDQDFSDLYCSPTIGWWKVINGTLDVGYTDIYNSPTMGLWKINGGTIDFEYNGEYVSPSDGNTYMIINGKVSE